MKTNRSYVILAFVLLIFFAIHTDSLAQDKAVKSIHPVNSS